MNKLYLITGNKNKAKDIQEMLGFPIEVKDLHLIEVQSMDLEVIIRHKAEEAFKKIKKPLIVEDVGLFLDAWNGFPGPFIRYVEDIVGYETLLKMMESEKNRKATVRIAVGYHDGKKVQIFWGDLKGNISRSIYKGKGWGFGPILKVGTSDKTYSELPVHIQHQISHRGKAIRKLKKYLQKQKIILT